MPCAGFTFSLSSSTSSSTAYDLLAKACRNGGADGFFFLVQSGANPLDRVPFNPESEVLTPEGWCVEQRHFRMISSGYAGIFRGDEMDRMQQYDEDSLLTLLASSRTPGLSIASFLIDQGRASIILAAAEDLHCWSGRTRTTEETSSGKPAGCSYSMHSQPILGTNPTSPTTCGAILTASPSRR